MLVNILQTFDDVTGTRRIKGQNLDVPREIAAKWIADGYAQADVDGGDDSEVVGGGAVWYAPVDATFAQIEAKALEFSASGGGHIVFMPVVYNIGDNTLPVLQGVYYHGVGLASTMQDRARRFGTLIRSTSTTKPAFGYNHVDRLTQYPTAAAFFEKNQLGAGIQGLNIEGGSYGVKVGAYQECGVENLLVRDVVSFSAEVGGLWFENCHIISATNLVSYDHKQFGFVYLTSGTGYWNHGQNEIRHITTQSAVRNAHCVIIGARGPLSSLNDTHAYGICAIGGGSEFTETVTLTAGNPNIPVSDLSKYALGCGVQFSGSLGTVNNIGLSTSTALTTYFVSAMSGTSGAGTIQVSYRFMDLATPVTPGGTGTASVTLGGRGGCGIVWGAVYTFGAPGSSTSSTIRGIDTEANGTCEFVINKMVYSHALMGILQGGAVGASARLNHASVVLRDLSYDIYVECPKRPDSIDWDGGGHPQWHGPSPIRGSTLPGQNYNPTRFGNELRLSTEGVSIYSNRHGDASGFRPLTGIGTALQVASVETTETTFHGSHTSNVTYRGSGTTYTLRANANRDELVGYLLNWFNYNATAVTLDGGGLNIEGLGTSSATISVPGKTGVMLQLRKANGVYFWARFV
jgi:hypothetical protein